jgi:nicotinate-nucleotide adenylyltransferase
MSERRRVGILGGTFSPPHHGHLICAQEARIQLGLDLVRLVPVGDPPHRDIDQEADPGDERRLQMVKLATEIQPGIEVSSAELDREGLSYTVDTLKAFCAAEPDTDFTLIVGADQAMAFGTWREPEEIGRLATIAVAARVDHNRDEAVTEVERATSGQTPAQFEMPRVDISSTFIRHRAYQGQSVAHLVPPAVAELIEREGLYR